MPFSHYIFLNAEHMVHVSTSDMSVTIAHHFSECIMWYFSKTTNHILGIIPFGVGSPPLEKYCNLKNVHIYIFNQPFFEHMVVLTVSNILRFWKGCSMSIIFYIHAEILALLKGVLLLWKEGLDIWKCTLHSFKGHGATFQGILHIFFGLCPCKNTPKDGYSYLEGYFVLITAFVGRHWDVVIACVEVIYHIMQKLCLLKGHCSSIFPR